MRAKAGRWLMLVAAIVGVLGMAAMQFGASAEASHGRYFNQRKGNGPRRRRQQRLEAGDRGGVGGWDVISVDSLLDIREALTKKFGLTPPDPDYFSRCRGMK